MHKPVPPQQDPELDAEFRAFYGKVGAVYMTRAVAIAAASFFAFYVVDVLSGQRGWFDTLQTFRLAVVTVMTMAAVFSYLRPLVIERHYPVLMTTFCFLGMQAACWISYKNHLLQNPIRMIWAMDMSLTICACIIFGFSRLSVVRTLLIVVVGCLSGTAYLFLPPVQGSEALLNPIPMGPQITVVVVHLSIVVAVLVALRKLLEDRERQLFQMAKENLRRNIYSEQLEAAKVAADAANVAKTRFLANMSHEIRTPMNGVLQVLEVIGPYASAAHQELIEGANASGRSLLRLLTGILDYTKLSSKAASIKLGPTDVRKMLESIGDTYKGLATEAGLDFQLIVDVDPAVRLVELDEVKLVEVISQLVSNSLKFTERGYVLLSTKCVAQGEWATIAIEIVDSGVGISESEQASLFTPFFQVDNQSTKSHDGTGLGLAICKEVIELLGGEISVRSAKGIGTKVTFQVRGRVLGAERDVNMPSQATLVDCTALSVRTDDKGIGDERRSRSVLLVEDNDLNAMLASDLLRKLHYSVTTAVNGEQGVEKYKERDFDLILMDCQMPVMDGYEATRRIRAYEKSLPVGRHTPIIAVTANTLIGDREACLECGMDDYLPKPYGQRQLAKLLAKWDSTHDRSGPNLKLISGG